MPHTEVEQGVERIWPLAAAPGMQKKDMSVFTDVRPMHSQGHKLFSYLLFLLLQIKHLQSLTGRRKSRT